MNNELYSEILSNISDLYFNNQSDYEYFVAMRSMLMDADVSETEWKSFNQMLLKEAA